MKTQLNKPLEIFYADDSKEECILFKQSLLATKLPSHLTLADDGEKAMDLLMADGYTPALIFLDLNMPYNGKQCIEVIKENNKLKTIPVIIYSISDDEKDIDDCYHKGATLYIVKPWSLKHQLMLLQKLFEINWDNYQSQPQRENFVFKIKGNIGGIETIS